MSLRIKRKINQISDELFFHNKTPSRINSPPYESKKKTKMNNIKEHICAMSPLKKKKHNCLLDILTRNKPNLKLVKGLTLENKKEYNRKIDEAELTKFMDKLINPSLKKLVCVKSLSKNN